MHCLLKFDIENQCVSETNKEVLKIVEKIKEEYNAIPDEETDKKKAKWRELVASTKEWHVFCKWCEELPRFVELTGVSK